MMDLLRIETVVVVAALVGAIAHSARLIAEEIREYITEINN